MFWNFFIGKFIEFVWILVDGHVPFAAPAFEPLRGAASLKAEPINDFFLKMTFFEKFESFFVHER